MASLVKTKTSIAVVSVVAFMLIHLLQTSFLMPVGLKRWSELSWEDFRRKPKLSSEHTAGIYSNLYLEFDSTLRRYHGFSGQSDIRSWVKSSYDPKRPDYLLIHEQYHFNLTEAVARQVDSTIYQNPDWSRLRCMMMVARTRFDLNRMQDVYDRETEHGTAMHEQWRWESKIDSLLKGE